MGIRAGFDQAATLPHDADPTVRYADPHEVADRAAGENFPVALGVLPRATRAHLLAIYGFARLVDDTGDHAPGDRLEQLDRWESELDRARDGHATHPVFVRLQGTIAALALDPTPLYALIEANRRDQTVHRYATWDDLRAYCALSADPVGRLVLAVFDAGTPVNIAWSDQVCTALQLVEHVQDIGEDYGRGRIYVPADDLARFGCRERDLGARRASGSLQRVVAHEVTRARGLLLAGGPPLCRGLRGWARLAVAGFVAGGLAALDAIEAADHDVLGVETRPTKTRIARHLVPLVVGRGVRP